ncbi:MAG: hypothetical protein ACXVDA_12055 [Ktedonobacterales bacterium]
MPLPSIELGRIHPAFFPAGRHCDRRNTAPLHRLHIAYHMRPFGLTGGM